MVRQAHHPEGTEPYSAAGGLVRVYPPTSPTGMIPNGAGLIWAHGGGFAGGDLDMPEADGVARALAARGVTVVSVDYPLAPTPQAWGAARGTPVKDGVHYPAASDAIIAAFRWAFDSELCPGPWALGGASAGANLAAGATLRLLRDVGLSPALVVLAYPTLLAVQPEPDAALRAALDADPEADTFGPDAVLGMYENYLGGPVDAAPLPAVPGLATVEELALFPPTLIINGEVDELRVSGEHFARTLAAAGRDIVTLTEPGTRHGHLNRPEEAAAAASIDRIAARLGALPPASDRHIAARTHTSTLPESASATVSAHIPANLHRRNPLMTNSAAADLIARSNRLGADPKNTNYAGGNTSAKGTETDPVTGEPVELLWVKGSGGDLGTLTEAGLAVLRLDRMRALVDVYPGIDREDEMVAAFDYCLHGKGGAAPSIDTAMHGLVDAAHVDHLHPDSGIAIATAKDGAKLTKRIFGGKVVWVPWRRPGFQLGLDIAAIKAKNPEAIGCILGGHGITAWGDTSERGRGELAVDHRDRAGLHRCQWQEGALRQGAQEVRSAGGGRAPGSRRRPGPHDPRSRLA